MRPTSAMTDRVQLDPSWKSRLLPEFSKPYMEQLRAFLETERARQTPIYPRGSEYFAALNACAFDAVKVIILGQDPYHGPGQAHGLSFSVRPGVGVPPSLVNIFKEIQNDLGLEPPRHGFLDHWARQGVLLLNTTLTVEAGAAGSHGHLGWQAITDAIVDIVASGPSPSVFMLWGNHARRKAERIEAVGEGRHLVLTAAHPSPLSARTGFFGCRHFSRANAFLVAHGRGAIDWRLEP